jgi:hypothetical protein
MNIRSLGLRQVAAGLILALGIALQSAPAAADPAVQVLDRVFTYNAGAVLNMAFGNASRPPDFTNLGLSASSISTCTLTPVDGLYCLDGKVLRNWPNPLAPAVHSDVLNCSDNALALDTAAGCTAMTVDRSGGIWLAGKKRLPSNWPARPSWIPDDIWVALQTWFKPYSLVKLVRKTAACPDASWATTVGGAYCAKEFYSGRFLISNLAVVDGDKAANFRPVPGGAPQGGVLAIEDLRNVLFFPDAQAAQPITISSGWSTSLKFGELLQDVTLLQLPGSGAKQNFVLATTTAGRVLSKNTATGALPVQVFNIPAERLPASAKCSTAIPVYGVRASPTADIVFVTDRAYCQVAALIPNSSTFTALVNLQQGGVDLTLSTKDSSGTFPVIGLTVAPGTGIDLRDCKLECSIINDKDGNPAAQLSGIQLQDGSSFTVTVFQVQDIPDCRYAFMQDFPPAKRALCASTPGVVINPDGTVATINPDGTSTPSFPSVAQLLNVTPLLPADVTISFDNSGVAPKGLPRLLISRQYRGQARNHFLFEALFVVPAPGVHYQGVFNGEYNVPALEGLTSSLGCSPPPPVLDPTQPHPVPPNLLAWDVTTAVSETYVSISGKYIDSLANSGCGSVKGEYSRMSLLPYDLEIAPDTYGPTVESTTPVLTTNNDAVFGRLVGSLISDLGYVFQELACKPVDNPGAAAPLSPDMCVRTGFNNAPDANASDQLYWIGEKFRRCMVGAFQNVNDDREQPVDQQDRGYCDAIRERFTQFQQALPALTPPQDIANRVGELKSRVDIIRHIYETRFLPSVPDTGFQSEPHDD